MFSLWLNEIYLLVFGLNMKKVHLAPDVNQEASTTLLSSESRRKLLPGSYTQPVLDPFQTTCTVPLQSFQSYKIVLVAVLHVFFLQWIRTTRLKLAKIYWEEFSFENKLKLRLDNNDFFPVENIYSFSTCTVVQALTTYISNVFHWRRTTS